MASGALQNIVRSLVASAAALTVCSLSPNAALAGPDAVSEAAAGPPQSDQDTGGLSEITVTATRRNSDLQRTPVSVTAVDAGLIAQVSPHDISDLSSYVPGFSVGKVPAQGLAAFAIRGGGSVTSIVYFEQPVAVLVDDFVISSIQTQLFDPFDVEQIEVLRGSQGTLFGKNTTAGVIVVRTKKPDLDAFSVQSVDGIGSYGSRYTRDAINIPLISNQLALRITTAYDGDDGYMKNGAFYGPINLPGTPWNGISGRGPGNSYGGQDVVTGRVKLLYEPNDHFDALLQYELLRDNSQADDAVNNTQPGSSELFNTLGFYGQHCRDPLDCGGSDGVEPNPYTSVDGGYLTMNGKFDFGTFTSVSGFRSQLTNNRIDTTGQPTVVGGGGAVLALYDLNRADLRQTWQEEIRFASSFSGPLNFVGGGFYQHEDINFCVLQHLGFIGLTDPFILCSAQQSQSEAAFGEGTYRFTDQLSATVGVRYSFDHKNWEGRQQAFASGITGDPSTPANFFNDDNLLSAADFSRYPDGVIRLSKAWGEPTYRFSLNYQTTPEIFNYFSYSHGYKAGGYSDQAGGGGVFGTDLHAFAQAAEPTNPELSNSFELGIKSQFFSDRLRANLTGFYVRYSDLQEQLNVPLTVNGEPEQQTVFLNAASAEVKGLEAEITARPLPELTVRAIGSYQKSRYLSFPAPGAGYDLASAPLPRAPNLQWTLDNTYIKSLGTWGVATLNGNVNYVAKNLFQQSITAVKYNGYLDAHTLVNGSLTVSDPGNKKYLRFIGRNLADKRYLTGNYPIPGLWGFADYGPPRYIGLEVGINF